MLCPRSHSSSLAEARLEGLLIWPLPRLCLGMLALSPGLPVLPHLAQEGTLLCLEECPPLRKQLWAGAGEG